MKHFSPDMQRARWEARMLQNALRQKGLKISTGTVMDIVALIHGWEHWRAWSQEQDWNRQPDPGRRENKSRGTGPTCSDRSRSAPDIKGGMTIELVD